MKSRNLSVGLIGIAVLAFSASAEAGTVRGKGRVVYSQNGANGGSSLPLAGVRVHLIDDDGLVGDDTMKTSYTDSNGYFDLSASDTDCWGCGKLDPYILVELESNGGKIVVESEVLKVNVTCATSVHEGTEGLIDFGTFGCGGTTGKDAGALFGYMQKAYSAFTQQTGQSAIPRYNGKAAALFPVVLAAGVPYTTEESIHWPGGFRSFKALYHEFGHRIRHAQDGDFSHFLSDVASYNYLQQHWHDKLTNEGFAFNEGWAEYNATLSDPDEATKLSGWNPASYSNGSNKVEGNVAARLVKLSKDCGGFKRMWATLQSGSFHTYNQFANKVKADFQASATLRSQFPNCMSSAIASIDTSSPSLWDLDHNHAPMVVASNEHHDGDLLVGALAPKEEGTTSEADQGAQLSRMGDEIKARAASKKSRNTLSAFGKLKPLGDKLAGDRDNFERKAAAKLDKHVKSTKAHDGSKAAIEKRRAENAAFVKDILQDRLTTLEAHLVSVKAEQAKNPTGPEAQALAQLRAKLEKTISELKEAMRTGNVEQRHLPRGFSLSADAMP